MIYGLRRFDQERTAAALADQTQGPVQGYMSAKSKIYLVGQPSCTDRQIIHTLIQSDASDHLEVVLSSLDQFSTMTDNLIDFVFNVCPKPAGHPTLT
jgi:hypothetical protein